MNDDQKVAIADRLMGEFGLDRETVARMVDAARLDAIVCSRLGTGENLIVEVPLDALGPSRTVHARFVSHEKENRRYVVTEGMAR
jgi:hypothetical protein